MAANISLRNAFLTGYLLLLAGSAHLCAQASASNIPRAQRHEYRREIDQAEEAWRSAILKGNAGALAALLADDYIAITSKGAIQTKQQAIESLHTGELQLTQLDFSDRKVRVYGSTAVVTSVAEIKGSRNNLQVSGRYRYTRVYVRNQTGQWKIVSFEASRIQETGDHK
jgi:ketosteroid isomerase-like protein